MNLYATPDEIKDLMPDGIRSDTTKYDDALYRLAHMISRFIDRKTRRVFFPKLETRYFDGDGSECLWIPDLISITSMSFSYDDGLTYETLASTDYYGTVSGSHSEGCAYNQLTIAVNGDYSDFPIGQRSVKVIGVWGYADDRTDCWEASGLTLSAEASAAATTLSVANVNAEDYFDTGMALMRGRLIKIGSEFMQVLNPASTVVVKRAMNGTTAAIQATASAIYLWRPPEAVKQATIIQAVRQLERAQQGFGDARATGELGQMFWVKELDPEAAMLLSPYTRMAL